LFTLLRLLAFRDRDFARRRLLYHLDSGGFDYDGFDYWSDRLFHFPRSFLHWCAFRLSLGDHSLRRLRYLACLTTFSRVCSSRFCSALSTYLEIESNDTLTRTGPRASMPQSHGLSSQTQRL